VGKGLAPRTLIVPGLVMLVLTTAEIYRWGSELRAEAVAIILNHDADKMPPEIEILVRTGIESGAALSGTIQTENIGFEKVVCNIVANPNIRYLIIGWS